MIMRASTENSGGERRRPREVTGRTVLICIVAFFGVVAAVNGVMIRAAISTFGGLETDSSYKAGLAFAREIAAAEAQDRRHWNVTAKLGSIVDGQWRIDVTARDAAGWPLAGYEAFVRLEHPTNRRLDHPIGMSSSGAGQFTGRAAVAPGQWELVVDLMKGDERMFRSRERIVLKDAGGR
jgi:nitrogen fixation protein FixH